MSSVEKRKRVRRRTSLAAVLTWELGHKHFPCVILDLTPEGARVSVPNSTLPHQVYLINIKGQYAHRCLVAWAKNAEAGLQFVEYIDLAKMGAISFPYLIKLLVAYGPQK